MKYLRRALFVAEFWLRPVTGPVPGETWTRRDWWAARMRWSQAWDLAILLYP